MKIIMKLIDVPANKIGPLHNLLAEDMYKGKFESHWHRDKGPEMKEVYWAKIIRAKSEDGESYVVDIELNPTFDITNLPGHHDGKVRTIFPSIEKIRFIYELLGVYPEEQKIELAKY